jgi:hypothetical protein
MGPAATTALGVLCGLIVFLAMAMLGAIAVNATSEVPGFAPAAEASAGAGATSGQGLDLNADGQLSLAEAAGDAHIVPRFNRADRNKDGRLSKAEYDRLDKLPPPKAKKSSRSVRESIRRDAAAMAKDG